ncbi:unnamed protein product [Pieris macdunnoughi]|uniref:Glycoprotein n=2 Tax=Pieris TaxID=7115 RepID=A0A821XY00_9NEOP|nr:unnamed protein product [Pieris macdunnoughi]CAF4950714.1 unnamed protein product [Pieris macdunnoughi]
MPCGSYCLYNQQFIKCRSNWTAYILGVVIAAILALVIILTFLCCFNNSFYTTSIQVGAWLLTRSDKRRAFQVKRHNKITGRNDQVKFREFSVPNNDLMNKIIDTRLALRKDVNGDEPLYGDIIYKERNEGETNMNYEPKNLLKPRTKPSLPELPPRTNSSQSRCVYYTGHDANMYLLACLFIVCLSGRLTHACDKVLYLSSKGTVCVKDKCQPIDTYMTTITQGQVICFNDINGDMLKLRIKKGTHISRYTKLYKTCSYNVTTTRWYNCKGSGACWEGNRCTVNYELNTPSRVTKEPHGYGCQIDSLGCDVYCHYTSRCVWYRWQVNPDYSNCGLVYAKSSELWIVEIETTYRGIKKVVTLNSNTPFVNMETMMPSTALNIPLVINTFTYERPASRPTMLSYKGKYYGVVASALNMPQENIIGDLQISLDTAQSIVFSEVHLPCSTAGCIVSCTTKEPALNRLTSNSPYLLSKDDFRTVVSESENWVSRNEDVTGTVTISFGSVQLKELVVIDAKCRINIIMTSACDGCLDKPFAVMSSDKMTTDGAVEYISNCTWDVPFFQCSNEPYIAKQLSSNKNCRVEIPKLNQTLDFDFEYIFRGEISSMRSIQSESFADIAANIGTDPNFWGSLVSSLTMMLSLTTIGTMLIKLGRLGVLSIAKRESEKA